MMVDEKHPQCSHCHYRHPVDFDCKPFMTGNVTIGGKPWYVYFGFASETIGNVDFYVTHGGRGFVGIARHAQTDSD